MAKKDKPEEIPSWIKDLYKEDLDRVVRGERPMYFRGMDDSPLRNVSPEFDILSGGAAVKGMNGIRGALSPLNNGMGNYNFSIRGINKKIGELVDEAGLYLPEKLRPVYRTVVDAMSSSKDKGLGYITQPLANALYPADERRDRRLDGEHPVGYVDAIDGIWPREKYGLWGEKIEEKQDGGEIDKDKLITLIKSSDANFARRLRDEKRKTIPDWEVDGNVATHKLGYAGVDGRYVIYPSVREIDGELYDFTDPKNNRGEWDALESAIADGDTIMVDSEREAEWLTGNYKNYFKSFDEYAEGGPVEDIARKMYRSDLDRVISGQSPQYYGQLNDRPLEDVHPEFDVLTGGVPMRLSPSYKMGLVGKDVFTNPWESSIYGKVFDKLDDYASIPNEIFTKYLGKTLRGIRRRIPDEEDKERFESAAKKVADNIHRDLDYYIGLISTTLADDEKDKKEDGGPVDTDKGYGEGKYVVDPGRSDNNKMVVYDEIWDYLTEKKGIPQTQAVGILANIAAESGGDTEALGAAGDFGIQQWLGPRNKELQRRYGKKPTLTQQLDYLVDEYQGRVPGLGWNYMNQGKFFDKDAQGNVYNYYMYSKADFDNATNYKDATVAWNQGYGRPLGSTLRNEKRFEFADMFSNRYGVPENEPMRYEFGQRDSGTGDGGQQPIPETVAPADPSLASRPSMDSWWEKEGQDLLYKMLAQSGANKKAIEDIANNIKNDPQSEAQIAEAERMRKEQAKRQLVLNMIPGLMLNIKGMSRTQN
nr:MAG: tail lysozyme [Bacteriophage sp.]